MGWLLSNIRWHWHPGSGDGACDSSSSCWSELAMSEYIYIIYVYACVGFPAGYSWWRFHLGGFLAPIFILLLIILVHILLSSPKSSSSSPSLFIFYPHPCIPSKQASESSDDEDVVAPSWPQFFYPSTKMIAPDQFVDSLKQISLTLQPIFSPPQMFLNVWLIDWLTDWRTCEHSDWHGWSSRCGDEDVLWKLRNCKNMFSSSNINRTRPLFINNGTDPFPSRNTKKTDRSYFFTVESI